jgi:hypothetical protein
MLSCIRRLKHRVCQNFGAFIDYLWAFASVNTRDKALMLSPYLFLMSEGVVTILISFVW